MIVRNLTPEQKQRFRECLRWLNAQERIDDPAVYTEKLREAKERWPDVAETIGF